MKPYRCQNSRCSEDPHGRLIFDFLSAEPVCPKCGIDGRKEPGIVIPLAIIHYDPPHPTITQTPMHTHKGTGFRACALTTKVVGNESTFATGNPTAVTCPECRKTDVWQKAALEWGDETVTRQIELELKRTGELVEVKTEKS